MINRKDMIDLFRASSTYINAHRSKVFVVLLSGEAQADDNFFNVVYDLSLLHSLGVKLVLVQGARPQITAALEKANIDSSYHQNLRVTESVCIEIVKQAVGSLGINIDALFSMGTRNSPMHGSDIRLCRGNFVTAKPAGIHDGVDFHFTGKVRRIHTAAINKQLNQGNLVVLSNLGYSLTGEVFNLSAEEIATEVAITLNAEKLILMIPEDGVIDDKGHLIPSLSESDAKKYADNKAILKDEDSKCISQALYASLRAYSNHVHRIHLISFKSNGALLQELFTREGNGSLVSNDSFDQLRDASISDVTGILNLIKPLENDGTLVERSRELLENEIQNFKIIELEGAIIACAALYPIDYQSGEIACIAIDSNEQKNGYGARLLTNLEKSASELGFTKLFVLTTVASHWFIEKGFSEAELDDLPDQRKGLYNMQRKSKVLLKQLS
jgi:amino-acid N-acetyltransferase